MTDAAWRRRFTAPLLHFPVWSAAAPDHLAFLSNEGGSLQVWFLDTGSGERRPLTDVDNGVERLHAAPDGSGAIWWLDETGDESGRWMLTPFDGGSAHPLLEVPDAWTEGLGLGNASAAVSLSDEDGYRVWVSVDGEPARVRAEHRADAVAARVRVDGEP